MNQLLTRNLLTIGLLAVTSACASAEPTNGPTSNAPSSNAPSSLATATTSDAATAPMASKADYNRVCGICHLENGEGVPGAFPPLDQRLASYASREAGRDYLVGLLKNGLYGQITVNDTAYNGAMPSLAFQLDPPAMAAMLNYALHTFAATDAGFTATEIVTRQTSVGSTAGATLRKKALPPTDE